MDINYISGFFDADGSITMSYASKTSPYRTIKIDFTNTELDILLKIKDFLFKNYNLNLTISTKQARKENHSISYTLACGSNQKCLELCRLLTSHHPKKIHRINTVLKYHDSVTKKNGKYSEKENTRRLAYERLFFCSSFH
jgi:hypothetical protein